MVCWSLYECVGGLNGPIPAGGPFAGTAMLLAAARNNEPRRIFRLAEVILAGSDLYPFIDLYPLIRSAKRTHSFYSPQDAVASMVSGAGAMGFLDLPHEVSPFGYGVEPHLRNLDSGVVRPDTAKFKQILVPGVQSATAEERSQRIVSWVSWQLTHPYYAEIFAIRTPRPSGFEDVQWIESYIKLREAMGSGWQIRASDDVFKPFP